MRINDLSVVQALFGDFAFIVDKYDVSVTENQSTNATVLVLQTRGMKFSEHVTYNLLNSVERAWFTLGDISFVLRTTLHPLDRESTPHIQLVIQACNRRMPPRISQTMVNVEVYDVKDYRPQFTLEPYVGIVPLVVDSFF